MGTRRRATRALIALGVTLTALVPLAWFGPLVAGATAYAATGRPDTWHHLVGTTSDTSDVYLRLMAAGVVALLAAAAAFAAAYLTDPDKD